VIRVAPVSSRVGYGVGLCPSEENFKSMYCPWKWCMLVNSSFHVEGLITAVEGLKTELGASAPSHSDTLHFNHLGPVAPSSVNCTVS